MTAITLSHNNRFLLTGGEHGEIRLWEMRSRELVSHLKEHTQRVTGLCLFESDTTLSSSSKDRSILRWDLRTEVKIMPVDTSIFFKCANELFCRNAYSAMFREWEL